MLELTTIPSGLDDTLSAVFTRTFAACQRASSSWMLYPCGTFSNQRYMLQRRIYLKGKDKGVDEFCQWVLDLRDDYLGRKSIGDYIQ